MSKKYLVLLLIAVGAVAFLAGNYFTPLSFRYQKSEASCAHIYTLAVGICNDSGYSDAQCRQAAQAAARCSLTN